MTALAGMANGWTLEQAEYVLAAALGCAAVVEDIARRTISNWLPIAALAGGMVLQGLAYGWMGLAWAALGTVSGFVVFLVFYLLGGMGGGDVKLMAGFGAILGAGRLLTAALWTALAGAALAAVVLLASTGRIWWRRRQGITGEKVTASIPYAPAIAAGVLVALVGNS